MSSDTCLGLERGTEQRGQREDRERREDGEREVDIHVYIVRKDREEKDILPLSWAADVEVTVHLSEQELSSGRVNYH